MLQAQVFQLSRRVVPVVQHTPARLRVPLLLSTKLSSSTAANQQPPAADPPTQPRIQPPHQPTCPAIVNLMRPAAGHDDGVGKLQGHNVSSMDGGGYAAA